MTRAPLEVSPPWSIVPRMHLSEHSLRLQSLRGIAALGVAVGHAFAITLNGRIEDANFTLRPGNAILAAGELLIQQNTMVIVFYVLSGFVLAASLRRHRANPFGSGYTAFAVRRFWRLLPVMWISLLLAIAVAIAVRHPPFAGVTGWFNLNFANIITPGRVLANFVGYDTTINSVLWSVQIELCMIPLIPLAVMLADRATPSINIVILAALCAISIVAWDRLPNFVLFAYCFYLGIALPQFAEFPLLRRLMTDGRVTTLALLLLIPTDFLFATSNLHIVYKYLIDGFVSAQLIAFLVLRPECRAARALNHAALVWLGDVSYSFYAFAMAVLIAVGYVLLLLVPSHLMSNDLVATTLTLTAAAVTVAIALWLAAISFRFVEKPSIALGRSWSSRIERGKTRTGTVASVTTGDAAGAP